VLHCSSAILQVRSHAGPWGLLATGNGPGEHLHKGGDVSGTELTSEAEPRSMVARRFVVAGEPTRRPDGTFDAGLEAQMQRAWCNLFDQMSAAGYERRHLLTTTVSVTQGGQLQLYRVVRDRMLAGHAAANSYLHVEMLARPGNLVEIEGVAAKD
jgi:2-iminobutanoate/2-iminopropanoate deaminase